MTQAGPVQTRQDIECPAYKTVFHNFVRVTNLGFLRMVCRYTLHTIKCTLFKHTINWFSVNSVLCNYYYNTSSQYLHQPKMKPYPG